MFVDVRVIRVSVHNSTFAYVVHFLHSCFAINCSFTAIPVCLWKYGLCLFEVNWLSTHNIKYSENSWKILKCLTSCNKPKKQTSKKQVAQTTKQKKSHKTNKTLGVSLDIPEGKSIPATLLINHYFHATFDSYSVCNTATL